MYQINNFTDNDDIRILNALGPFTVIEYLKDLSVMPQNAQTAYFANQMNVRKRQVICVLLIGVPYAVNRAIDTNVVRERRTTLAERLA